MCLRGAIDLDGLLSDGYGAGGSGLRNVTDRLGRLLALALVRDANHLTLRCDPASLVRRIHPWLLAGVLSHDCMSLTMPAEVGHV